MEGIMRQSFIIFSEIINQISLLYGQEARESLEQRIFSHL